MKFRNWITPETAKARMAGRLVGIALGVTVGMVWVLPAMGDDLPRWVDACIAAFAVVVVGGFAWWAYKKDREKEALK